MLLDKKTAIVYGAAGAIGSEIARAYAREGAEVHLAGRTKATLEKVARRIQQDGGAAHVTHLDVLDQAAVEQHAAAVGRHMTRRGHGVILVMAGGREAIPRLGGSHVAWAALAGLCRQLGAEFGPHGVRVNWLLSPGPPGHDEHDQRHHETSHGENEAAAAPGTEGLLIRHQPSYDEVANIATFAASDWARTITASEINFTGGAVID